MTEPKQYFKGAIRSPMEMYALGMEDERTRSNNFRRDTVKDFVSELRGVIFAPGNVTVDRERSAPGFDSTFAKMLHRAAEHLVTNIDPTTAATPHGTFPVPGNVEFGAQIIARWTNYLMPCERYATVIDIAGAMVGSPTLPTMVTPPAAGTQPGEKQPTTGTAFDIQPDPDSTLIDASYYLNVSQLIYDAGLGDWVSAIMQAAVMRDTNRQIVADMASKATAGATGGLSEALAAFDGGNYNPAVVVVPPSGILDSQANVLADAGVVVVVDSAAPTTLVVDPTATAAVFKQMSMSQFEPATYGNGVAFKVTGRIAVDPAGVVSVTTP